MQKKVSEVEVLYLSLDGIMEPLGHSQVFKYLEGLSKSYKVNLVTFEKTSALSNSELLEQVKAKCKERKINWHRLTYSSGLMGLGLVINIIKILSVPLHLMIKKKILLVHIRSYMPGLIIPLLSIFFNFKFIFDIRGFWADEKADRSNWNRDSLKYKFFKSLERYLIQRADCVVTLTKDSQTIIAKNFVKDISSINVIPTCVDWEEFQNFTTPVKNFEKIRIGYLGSIDTAYDFQKFTQIIQQIQHYYHGKIELKVFTSYPPHDVAKILSMQEIKNIDVDIRFLERADIPNEISQCSFVGFCLKENFSIAASMPTKIAETLACGVPIVCNAFNTDVEDLIRKNNIGLIHNFDEALQPVHFLQLQELLRDLNTAERCSNAAKKYFSLDWGVTEYKKIYSMLLEQ